MEDITRLNIIEILQDLKQKDLQETAKRVYMLINKIYKYAVTLEYIPHNIVADIEQRTILGKRDKKHYLTFTKEKDIKGLLLGIEALLAHKESNKIKEAYNRASYKETMKDLIYWYSKYLEVIKFKNS